MESVLHIGFDATSHSKEGLRKGFLAAGFIKYNFLNWQNLRLDMGILGCQARMIQAAKNLSPNLIFCQFQNPEVLDEETVIELSKCGFTVNYTFDVRDAERTEWMYELAPYFGLTLFACMEDVEEAYRRGIKNVEYIHSSCDPDQYRPLSLSEEEKEKYPEIVFVANGYHNTNLNFENAEERQKMVNFMKEEFGGRFGVLGINWGSGSRIINPEEEVVIYNSTKVVICHNNYTREGYCSDRQWRSMSCGALTILHSYRGLFSDLNGYYPSWKTVGELANECRYFLSDDVSRNYWAEQQRGQFLQKHTWKHRIEEVKEIIWKLKQNASTPTRSME